MINYVIFPWIVSSGSCLVNNILFRFKFDYKHTGHHRDCKEVCFWKKTKPWAFRDISGGACTRRGELNAAPPSFPFPKMQRVLTPKLVVWNISVRYLEHSTFNHKYLLKEHPLMTVVVGISKSSVLTLHLPWVTKKQFLLTRLIQYQADKRWELRKILTRDFLVDLIPNSPN